MKNNTSFENKIIDVVFVILVIKIGYTLLLVIYLPASEFILSLLSTIFISFLLLYVLRGFKKGFGFQSNNSFNNSSSSSSVMLETSIFSRLQKKYLDLAQSYVDQKEYKKAAHIHMRLLKDNYTAAEVLNDGGLYLEAASIYSKYLRDDHKAAACFEKGKAYKDALNLYLKTGEEEKAGDMYKKLNDIESANKCYNKAVQQEIELGKYIKASQIIRHKIKSHSRAQQLLLEGWNKNFEKLECLTNYFKNLDTGISLEGEIKSIYHEKTNISNRIVYFHVLKNLYGKSTSLDKLIRNISYEIVAQLMDSHIDLVAELNYLNSDNKNFAKDVLKYKITSRNKKRL